MPADPLSILVPGYLGVVLLSSNPLVLVSRRSTGRTSPFVSDNLTLLRKVAGCLAQSWGEWLRIGAEKWVLDVLKEGYRIPFSAPPPYYPLPGLQRLSTSLSQATSTTPGDPTVEGQDGCGKGPLTPGFYSLLLVLPKATGGFRPIIDLSILNQYVITTSFKMETVQTVMSVIRQDDWMVSLDLKDAYLQVPIHPDSRRFLRLIWEVCHFQFRALCFGLSTAPQVFTRLMAPVSAEFLRQEFRFLRYLDD